MRLIDADALCQGKFHECDSDYKIGWNDALDAATTQAPTVDAVPVAHGRWIDMQEDEATEGMWRCSACGSDRYFDIMTPTECGCYYCPNCGAKMDGGTNGKA